MFNGVLRTELFSDRTSLQPIGEIRGHIATLRELVRESRLACDDYSGFARRWNGDSGAAIGTSIMINRLR
jgi:hypothetical protein